MKPYLTLCLAVLSTLTGCDLGLDGHQKDTRTELEKLPPLTTTGENTCGYLLNGKAIVNRTTLNFIAMNQGGFFNLGGGGLIY